MRKPIVNYLSSVLAIFLLSKVIDTIHIGDIPSLLLMGLVLMAVNLFLKPLLLLVALPLNILTLGLFSFIVNAGMIIVADYFVAGISMGGFLNSLIAAFVISIVSHILGGK